MRRRFVLDLLVAGLMLSPSCMHACLSRLKPESYPAGFSCSPNLSFLLTLSYSSPKPRRVARFHIQLDIERL